MALGGHGGGGGGGGGADTKKLGRKKKLSVRHFCLQNIIRKSPLEIKVLSKLAIVSFLPRCFLFGNQIIMFYCCWTGGGNGQLITHA